MMASFGTDGLRGEAGTALTPELVTALGRAAARALGGRWVVGRDTRRSGPMLEAALCAGLAAEGATVERLGVATTPAVACIAERHDAAAAVVSASHNRFSDNGIKLFGRGGLKLSDGVEEAIERLVRGLLGSEGPGVGPVGANLGTIEDRSGWEASYLGHVAAAVGHRTFRGMRVVLDTANGASSLLGPEAFASLGADVTTIHDQPDGCNINDHCGATHPEDLRVAVAEQGADLGLAFDGDGDRLIAVDHTGAIVDGDEIMAICARDLHDRRQLRNETVVVTVMTNLGFHLAMRDAGISVVETPVGDRNVLEAMEAHDAVLGGEQSGHVIFRDHATTGDGVLTGLAVLDVVARRGRLRDLAAQAMTKLPQVLVNVPVPRSDDTVLAHLDREVAAAKAALGGDGRVLVRASGTEPLIRVMVEARSEHVAAQTAETLAQAVRRSAGGADR
jgi:phosphoglucosamine mutase